MIHRNLLLPCDHLPTDLVVKDITIKKGDASKAEPMARKMNQSRMASSSVDDVDSDSSEEEDWIRKCNLLADKLNVECNEEISESSAGDGDGHSNVDESSNEESSDENRNEESAESDSEHNESLQNEPNQDFQGEELRYEARQRFPPKRFTYDVIGEPVIR